MAIDKKELQEFIEKETSEAIESHKMRAKNLDEWTKRFEALRSTGSLDDDVKRKPWLGAANVGIPIDATVVYTLAARLMRATWGVDPAASVRPFDLPASPYIQRYINWQMWEEAKLFMPLMLGYQSMLIDGDKLFKTSLQKDEVYFDTETILFLNDNKEPYISPDTGTPLEAEDEDQDPILDQQTLQFYYPKKIKQSNNKVVYHAPGLINIPIKSFIVPANADDPDVNKIDWCVHEYWKPWGWLAQRSKQFPELFDSDTVNEIKKDKDKDRKIEPDRKMMSLGVDLKTKTKMFKFHEWHGKYEDDDGKVHEIVALMLPDEKKMAGFTGNRFYFKTGGRQFVHYTCFPQDNRFYGKGVVEWLRGVRSMLDALINSGMDRAALYGNPPLIYDLKGSGFDPSEHKFGPGKSWGLRRITPDALRTLELPTTEQNSLVREELLFSIVQRLFGITDYALGSAGNSGVGGAATATSKTASGIMSVINEGNIRFDVLIKLVQEWSNPELARQLFKHFTLNRYSIMKTEGLNKPKEIFEPIMQMSEKDINTNFEFMFKGNTSTVNPAIEQENSTFLYKLMVDSKNPFVVDDPDVVHDMTEHIFNAYQQRGLKIKSVEEFRQMSATAPQQANAVREQAIKNQLNLPNQQQLLGVGQ